MIGLGKAEGLHFNIVGQKATGWGTGTLVSGRDSMLIWCVTLSKSLFFPYFRFLICKGGGVMIPASWLSDWLRIRGSSLYLPTCLWAFFGIQGLHVVLSTPPLDDLTSSHGFRSVIYADDHKIYINSFDFSPKFQSFRAKVLIGYFLVKCFALSYLLLFYQDSHRPHFNLYMRITHVA